MGGGGWVVFVCVFVCVGVGVGGGGLAKRFLAAFAAGRTFPLVGRMFHVGLCGVVGVAAPVALRWHWHAWHRQGRRAAPHSTQRGTAWHGMTHLLAHVNG